MSSDNPPYPYYPSIPFNPSFFTSNAGTGLTESTANSLYLRKTVADTATAQETFSSGVITNSITGTAVSSTMAIGSNLTTGNMTLGSALTTGNINLGNNNTSVVQVNGRLQTNFVRSKDIINTLEIGDDQTSGILNLGYRPADALRTGAVNIGSANATTTVYGTLNIPTSVGASSNAVNVSYLTTALANVATLNQIQTFNQTNTFDNATAGIKANVIAGVATTGTQSLFGTKTAGTLNIATSQTTGDINIGGGTSTAITLSGKVNCNLSDVGIMNIKSLVSGQAQLICQPFADTDPVVYFRNADRSQIRGTITGTSTTIAYNTSSDKRLKTNIADMSPMLEKIMSLKPSEYNWVIDKQRLDYGLIAQEVFEVFPHMKPEVEPEYFGLDYGRFTPFIIKAIQELKSDYDAKLSTLEARLLALETKPVFPN